MLPVVMADLPKMKDRLEREFDVLLRQHGTDWELHMPLLQRKYADVLWQTGFDPYEAALNRFRNSGRG